MTLFHILALLRVLVFAGLPLERCDAEHGVTRSGILQLTKPADPVPPWIVAFKKGDVSFHRRTVTLSGRAPNGKRDVRIVLKSTERVEIRDVNARGEATVVTACASMEITGDGRTEPIEGARYPAATRVFGKNGMVIRGSDSPGPATEPLLIIENLLANNPAPSEAVNVGTTWRTEFQNVLTPGKRVTMISRFLGPAPVFGIPTVKTAFTLDVPPRPAALPSDTISATGERCLDTAAGRIVQFRMDIRNVVFAAQGGLIKGAVQIIDELVVPGVNDKATGDSEPGRQ